MTDGNGTGVDAPDAPSARYRAVMLGQSGETLGMVRLPAANDPTALIQAGALVDGCAVELWDGMRYIHHFPRKE